jgi:adenylosuccinate synthase
MSNVTIGIGLQYGDEGKGKIFDKVVNADVWARFNAGSNAGHGLEIDGHLFTTHGLPCGVFRDAELYIGSGCVLNSTKVIAEINEANELIAKLQRDHPELKNLESRLFISPHASLVKPHSIVLDKLTGGDIGTTGNGIGHTYADQALRTRSGRTVNIKFGEFLSKPEFYRKQLLEEFMSTPLHLTEKIDNLHVIDEFYENTLKLKDFICNDPNLLDDRISQGKSVFMEGANSIMLDVIKGYVPYVTGSRTLAGAAYSGGDLPPRHKAKVIGVAKAIQSRVGHGPMIGEYGGALSEEYCMKDEGRAHQKAFEKANFNPEELLKSGDDFKIGQAIRIITKEYGASTGRPRRLGILDLVMLRESCRANSVEELYITKVDCLELFSRTHLPGIPVIVGYNIDGEIKHHLPFTLHETLRAKPIVEYISHIRDKNLSNIRHFKDLPKSVCVLIHYIEEFTKTRIAGIGVGPGRDDFVPIPTRVNSIFS